MDSIHQDLSNIKEIFDQNYSSLVYFANCILKDRAEAEDLVQDVFVKFWRRKQEISDMPVTIKSYLYTAVKNLCLNQLRHRKVQEGYMISMDRDDIDENNVVNVLIEAEVVGAIHRALAALPERCRQVSELGFIEGKTNQEIAIQLEISVNTVKTQKQRALKFLRQVLSPEMVGLFIYILNNKLQD